MRFAVIASGTVVNVIMAEQGYVDHQGRAVVQSDTAGVGWNYNDSVFTAPVVTAAQLTAADLVSYSQMKQQALLKAGITVNVAASGSPTVNILCDGTNATRADLALLALFGQQNPTGTKQWLDNNDVVTTLTGTELVNLATLVGAWISDTYPTLVSVINQINASPPTITTIAQIDAASWGD